MGSPPPCCSDPACGCRHPPFSSELSGLPYRRHFPWNLILLTIFVSDLGVAGDRCCVGTVGGGRRVGFEGQEAWAGHVQCELTGGGRSIFIPLLLQRCPTFPLQMGLVSPSPSSIHCPFPW